MKMSLFLNFSHFGNSLFKFSIKSQQKSKLTYVKNKSPKRPIILFHVCNYFTHHTLIPTHSLFTRKITAHNTFNAHAFFTNNFYEYFNFFHNQL